MAEAGPSAFANAKRQDDKSGVKRQLPLEFPSCFGRSGRKPRFPNGCHPEQGEGPVFAPRVISQACHPESALAGEGPAFRCSWFIFTNFLRAPLNTKTFCRTLQVI